MSCRADPMTVNGQLSRPRPGSYLAVSGQSAVAAVKPWKNPFIESFNSRLRDECLNINLFWSMTHAQVVIGDWKTEYNHDRPHSSLGYLSPVAYAAVCTH